MSDAVPQSTRRKVLIISPAFAPVSTPDSQRVRMSLPYYPESNWDAVVLRVIPSEVDGPRENDLLKTLPENVRIVTCGAWSRRALRTVGLGNLGWRAFATIFWNGFKLLRREHFDLVFFSTTQFAVFPLGRIWRALTGTPYIIDLQDPWRTDYYERRGVRKAPGGWKYQFARFQAALLEEWSFRKMVGFMAVSPGYISDLTRRYPWFREVPSAAIRFGVSQRDHAVARTVSVSTPNRSHESVCLVYTGAAGPIMPHATRILFTALQRFRARWPEKARRLRLRFLGTSYAAADRAEPTVLPLAQTMGVDDQVDEVAQRLGHLECMELQRTADGLLLLGSSDPAYSPSKLYPYYLAERPILGLVFAGSDLARLLKELQCANVALCESTDVFENALQTIESFFSEAVQGFSPLALGARDRAAFEREYSARSLTAAQVTLFNRAIATRISDVHVV